MRLLAPRDPPDCAGVLSDRGWDLLLLWGFILPVIGIVVLLLSGCGEPAAKWDDKRGRFISTSQLNEEARLDRKGIERRLDKLEQLK